jgi:hypothetical protein
MKPGLIFLCATLLSCARPPHLSLQGHFFLSTPNEALAQRENPQILAAVEEIVTAIVNAEPERILKYIDREKGAIIDAKAFVPYAQVASALTQPTAQLHRVLWNDAYWKETAPNDNIRSYQKIFSSAGEIRIGIFYYSASECEVRLDFKNRPSMGIMGNPIFRKRDQRWYLVNFF